MTRSLLPLALAIIVAGAANLARADDHTSGEKHEILIKDVIKGLDDWTTAWESVKDDQSATAGAKKVNEVSDRLDKLADEAKKLGKLPKEKEDELKKKYEKDLKKSVALLQAAAKNAEPFAKKNPDLLEAAKKMIAVVMKLQSIGGSK